MNLLNLKERRLAQLKDEEKMDKLLQKSFSTCPNLVFQFLMTVREINRGNAERVYSSSFLNFPAEIEASLQGNQNTLDTVLQTDSENVCHLLS
jgi:hypothetical protein